MELKHIFQNWIITLVFGSLLPPISLGLDHGGISDVYKGFTTEFYIVPMALVTGLIISIPSLILMLIAAYSIKATSLKSTCNIGANWLINAVLIVTTMTISFGTGIHKLDDIMLFSLPYLLANSAYYAYHRFKPYRKPQVLNFPA